MIYYSLGLLVVKVSNTVLNSLFLFSFSLSMSLCFPISPIKSGTLFLRKPGVQISGMQIYQNLKTLSSYVVCLLYVFFFKSILYFKRRSYDPFWCKSKIIYSFAMNIFIWKSRYFGTFSLYQTHILSPRFPFFSDLSSGVKKSNVQQRRQQQRPKRMNQQTQKKV